MITKHDCSVLDQETIENAHEKVLAKHVIHVFDNLMEVIVDDGLFSIVTTIKGDFFGMHDQTKIYTTVNTSPKHMRVVNLMRAYRLWQNRNRPSKFCASAVNLPNLGEMTRMIKPEMT